MVCPRMGDDLPPDGRCPKDTQNKLSRRSHPRIASIRSLAFAINSTTIDGKCRLLLPPIQGAPIHGTCSEHP